MLNYFKICDIFRKYLPLILYHVFKSKSSEISLRPRSFFRKVLLDRKATIRYNIGIGGKHMRISRQHEILKSLTDSQLDKLMDIMYLFNFNVSQALVFGYEDIMAA